MSPQRPHRKVIGMGCWWPEESAHWGPRATAATATKKEESDLGRVRGRNTEPICARCRAPKCRSATITNADQPAVGDPPTGCGLSDMAHPVRADPGHIDRTIESGYGCVTDQAVGVSLSGCTT